MPCKDYDSGRAVDGDKKHICHCNRYRLKVNPRENFQGKCLDWDSPPYGSAYSGQHHVEIMCGRYNNSYCGAQKSLHIVACRCTADGDNTKHFTFSL